MDFEGANLSVDSDGVLHALSTLPIIRDDGAIVTDGAADIDFGANLTVSDIEDSVRVDANQWDSDVDAGGHELANLGRLSMVDDPVIGTTDGSPLEIELDGERALRLEPVADTRSAPNLIAGHWRNGTSTDVRGATIAGGGLFEGEVSVFGNRPNEVTSNFGTIGGGFGNVAGGGSTIGGGTRNAATSVGTVSGGTDNVATVRATVGGGETNTADARFVTVGGG